MTEPSDDVPEISPERISQLSEKAMASCQASAAELRSLGEACAALGTAVQKSCAELAADFESQGRVVSSAVHDFATRVHGQHVRVRALYDEIKPAVRSMRLAPPTPAVTSSASVPASVPATTPYPPPKAVR